MTAYVNDDHYVILNGLSIAYIGHPEKVWLHPRNWLKATRDLSMAEQGALYELIRTHTPKQPEAAS